MRAHYGYKDGSGDYFIIVDTDKCNGCGECVEACPHGVLEIIEDEFNIEDGLMAAVTDEHRRRIKYSCGPCKPVAAKKNPPCILACQSEAISHSW